MKVFRLLIVLLLLAFVFSTCKKEDENRPPSKPKLLEPAQGAVVAPEKITFRWEESTDPEGEDIFYKLLLSSDSINWELMEYAQPSGTDVLNNYGGNNYFPFEIGKKYYWKVTANSNKNYDVSGISESDAISFFTYPEGVANLGKVSGDGFVNLTWTDPAGLSKVEVTFSPAENGITQPITVNPGIGKLDLQGMTNSTVYSFYVKAFNSIGLASKVDTLKAMPLAPTLVHDADFNIYSTVQIGTQTWMRENLKTSRWQDGSIMINYGEKLYEIGSQSNIYGYYYSYNVAIIGNQDKNPCPCGYHVPYDEDFLVLEQFLGMSEADLLKEGNRGELERVGVSIKSSTGWSDFQGNSGNGSDIYGLKILPSGIYGEIWQSGGYEISEREQGRSAYFLSANKNNPSDIEYGRIFYSSSDGIARWKLLGIGDRYSIRCVKD